MDFPKVTEFTPDATVKVSLADHAGLEGLEVELRVVRNVSEISRSEIHTRQAALIAQHFESDFGRPVDPDVIIAANRLMHAWVRPALSGTGENPQLRDLVAFSIEHGAAFTELAKRHASACGFTVDGSVAKIEDMAGVKAMTEDAAENFPASIPDSNGLSSPSLETDKTSESSVTMPTG